MTYITQAALRGIEIDQLKVAIEGQVDLGGVFGIGSARAGLSNVSVTVLVRSSADVADLDEIGRTVTQTSAVYDSLASPVPMRLLVQRLPEGAPTEESQP